ncbi:ISKra4 family transposase [Microvirga makkahensis]|uniref:ISKra4 family transposase n=1 Tax=Microvirga makkahensis TaxID=1128670 RepID=A0A7X3MPB6_9HYPH|nr:ISKra4 family transposase [Microvirga makkahensis]MXQ10588.1 ISKra4 family transposase [Microvirga makkahensis]
MQVRIMLQIVGDDGTIGGTEEIAALTKVTEGAEDLGLSLAESKALLAAAQQRIVEAQVNGWLENHRHCKVTGRKLRCKGSYSITFRTLFGDVQLKSPRFYLPKERQTNGPATISPLTQLIPDHVAPERMYLETRWASLVPYAAAAGLLADVLPVESGVNATTVRQHVLRAAERMESDLAEQRVSFMEGTDPRDWEDLPIPDGRMVIGLDCGYIRDWRDRKKNFELIVGRSMSEEGDARYIGFVHGYDRKPQRRIIDHLRRQGFQADQDLTFITDGGDEVRGPRRADQPVQRACPCLVHITMQITVLRQFAQGLVHHDKNAGTAVLDGLRRIKWFLWHGNIYRAREAIDDLVLDLEALDSCYPNLRKLRTTIRKFQLYITSNEASLINYGERYRSGERISSAFVEATVNAVISKRFAKKQQMQWSRRGAHLLLQTRTRTLDGSLRAAFEHWYPGMMNDNDRSHRQAAA